MKGLRIAVWMGLGLAAATAHGCLNIGAYTCEANTQCVLGSDAGVCQPATGFCSFPDPACPTGFRYGDDAGDGLGGECVEPATASTTLPMTTGPDEESSTSGDASSTGVDPVTTLQPTTDTDTDTTGGETGDTCGSPGQPCCGDGSCDADLSCFEGTCGCVDTLDTGDNHTCITKVDGSVWCWGANDTGQLGVPGLVSSATPVRAADALLGGEGLRAVALDASSHTCAVREDGQAVCWGENATGASVPALPSKTPAVPTLINTASNFAQPVTGTGFTCISRSAEFLATCFGTNTRGQLTGADALQPVDVVAKFTFAEMVGGTSHTCGRTATGDLYCWGENASGQLGTSPATVPFSTTVRQVLVPPVGDIAAGRDHTCARVSNQVQCWGANALGQLGDGTGVASVSPVTVLLAEAPIQSLTSANDTTCAIQGAGQTFCWGDNQGDKLLNAGLSKNDAFSTTPVLIDITDAAGAPVVISSIAHGDGHGCILSDTHEVMCWGLNSLGQVGNGILSAQVLAPEPVTIECP